MPSVYVGWDHREQIAYDVVVASLTRRASTAIDVVPLRLDRLEAMGLLFRTTDLRGGMYDMTSNAPVSTEFSISRFLVPHLAQTGHAVFLDCDMVVLADIADLFKLADPSKAVQVVKHDYQPRNATKMDGAVQTSYPRKNWSSLVLWNCDHPANRRLSITDVNHRRGIDLHQFYWLHDSEIGTLPAEWNWLVGDQPKPADPKIAHFTNGGPFIPNWTPREHDRIWNEEHSRGEKW